MDANDVAMVLVGLEQLGAEEFVQRKFFDGGTRVCVCVCVCVVFWLLIMYM